MKKLLAVGMCFIMVVLLAGCASLGIGKSEPDPEPQAIVNYYESSVEPQAEDPTFTTGVGPAYNAFDGDMKTRWSSIWEDNQWISVEFADVAKIYGLKIYWEDAFTEHFTIQVSDDNETWTDVYEQEESEGGVEKIKFKKPVYGKFLRIACHLRATMFGNSMWEIQIWQTKEEMKEGRATD